MTESTYWLAGPTGEKAVVKGNAERDRFSPHGWQEATAPTDGDFVWMSHPDAQKPGLIAWGAREYWQGVGWQPSAPPEPVNPAIDPTLNDAGAGGAQPPDGTVDEVKTWVGGDPLRAEAALKAEGQRDAPRTTLVDALEKARAGDTETSAAPAAPSKEG